MRFHVCAIIYRPNGPDPKRPSSEMFENGLEISDRINISREVVVIKKVQQSHRERKRSDFYIFRVVNDESKCSLIVWRFSSKVRQNLSNNQVKRAVEQVLFATWDLSIYMTTIPEEMVLVSLIPFETLWNTLNYYWRLALCQVNNNQSTWCSVAGGIKVHYCYVTLFRYWKSKNR